MIEIHAERNRLLLEYSTDFANVRWVDKNLQESKSVTISRTFTFRPTDLVTPSVGHSDSTFDPADEDSRIFVLGRASGNYYKIRKDVLGLKHDLLIAKEMQIGQRTFVATRQISIFRKIDSVVSGPIVLGGHDPNAMPADIFEELLRKFPTSVELDKYARARIEGVLRDHFGVMTDAEKKLDKYLNRRLSHPCAQRYRPFARPS